MKLPLLIALGAGLSPHLTRAVYAGMNEMSGEFVRTPKRGSSNGRYRLGGGLPWLARLPMVEGEWAEAMIKTIKEGPQPAVAVAVTNIYYQACKAPSPLTGKKNEPSFLAIACIKAGISVIDGILRVKSD